MEELPIDSLLPELDEALRRHRAAVVVAPPGAGKTTRIPPALLHSGLIAADHPNLVLLQPRRIAARAASARIAEENAWSVGSEVGYHIRFERRIGPTTRLRVLTEGVLTRQLLADPFLQGVGAVILDEFHERSLHSDLALALLREVRESVREDLLLIVMSATLDPEPVAEYLGGCPILRAAGRAFPITIEYQPPSAREMLPDQVARALRGVLATGETGDILVFLPGMEEIRRTERVIRPLAEAQDLFVLPLHGSLSSQEQDQALRPAARRKVVLATNVAETSLTIEGIRTVIDTGLARFAAFDPARGLDRLELGRISKSSAVQRAGRAGRTGPGRCVRLWSPRDERGMKELDVPEVRRVDLAECLLALHHWGHANPSRFGWYEPPPPEALEGAERVLEMLGALDPATRRITPLGKEMLRLPVHPRLSRLLIGAARRGRLFEGASLAALLAEKDIIPTPSHLDDRRRDYSRTTGDSDLLLRLDRLEEAERARFAPALRERGLDPSTARRVAALRDELFRIGRHLPGTRDAPRTRRQDDEETLLKLLMNAYPDRLARRRQADPAAATMVGGRGLRLDPDSIVRDAELFLALDPREDHRGGVRETRVRLASAVRVEWIEECLPGSLRRERTARFDESRGRAAGVDSIWYRDLLLCEEAHSRVTDQEAADALLGVLRGRAESFFLNDPGAAAWLTRWKCLREWIPDRPWPGLSETELYELLAEVCYGRRSLEELRRLPLVPLLQSRLTHGQVRDMQDLVPEALTVPSGSRHPIRYELGRPPVMAVRLQELFGWQETPRIAGGRVPVVLHILGPNFRPVQVTDDLRSFWSTTYFQVRKDLRARYPNHAWPEDPLSARAEAKGQRRRR
jgi:ATP-dependent helicase HrpB